jgi:hypothetical protein
VRHRDDAGSPVGIWLEPAPLLIALLLVTCIPAVSTWRPRLLLK